MQTFLAIGASLGHREHGKDQLGNNAIIVARATKGEELAVGAFRGQEMRNLGNLVNGTLNLTRGLPRSAPWN